MIENFVFLVTIDDNDKFILFFLVYKCCAAGEYFLTPSFNTTIHVHRSNNRNSDANSCFYGYGQTVEIIF